MSISMTFKLTLHRKQKLLQTKRSLFTKTLLKVFPYTLAILFVFASLCTHAQANRSQGNGVDYERAKQQGLTYFNKKMLTLASEQFDLAYSTPLGKADFVVIYYRGYLAKQQLRLETAFEMAELAINLSDQGSSENAQAQQLLDELKGQFNYVTIKPAKQETNKQGRIYLETKRRIINKQKREQFESIRLRFRSTDVSIPTKIYLPYGKYTANNVPFDIKRNSKITPEVEVFLAIKQDAKKSDSSAMLYTGLGITGAAVVSLGAYLLLKPEDQYIKNVKLNFEPISPSGN